MALFCVQVNEMLFLKYNNALFGPDTPELVFPVSIHILHIEHNCLL